MSTTYASPASFASSSGRRPILVAAIATLLILGLGYRFGYLLPHARVFGDGFWRYDPLARNLLAGHGFSTSVTPPYAPDIFDVPGYPLFVAAIYAISHASSHALAIAQFFVEFLILGLVYRALQLTGLSTRGAWTAVLLGWLLPNIATWCRETYADVLASLVVTVLLFLLIRTWTRPIPRPARWGLLVGASAGVCALVRVDTYPIIAFAGIALAATPALAIRRRLALLGAYALGLLVLVLPWVVRDYRLTGQPHPPGWQQYTQAGDPYLRWCNTWVDDPDFVLPYMLHRGAADAVRTFPADRIPNSAERLAAEAAYARWIAAGSEGEPKAEFQKLAEEAERRLTLPTQLRMRFRRAAMVWIKLPSMADLPGGAIGKAGKYAAWLLLLFGAAAALVFGVARRQWWLILPLGVIAGRMLIPLASALGTEIRYQYPALPALYILAGFGLEHCYTAIATRRRRMASAAGSKGFHERTA